MACSYPNEGFNGFVMLSGQDVVYSTTTDASTNHPRLHRETMMWTPYGFLVPSESNHVSVYQMMTGVASQSQVYAAVPLITADGSVYLLECYIDQSDKRIDACLIVPPGDITATMQCWTTDYPVRNVINTCMYLTHSVEKTIDHIVKFHGCRREYIHHTTVSAIAAECVKRGLNKSIQELKYGCLQENE